MIDLRNSEAEEESRKRVDKFLSEYSNTEGTDEIEGNYENEKQLKPEISRRIRDTLPVLVGRSFKNILRQPPLVIARFAQVISFSIILLIHFAPVQKDQASIQTRFGIIQECLVGLFLGMLNCLAVYPQERNNFYSEYSEGVVSVEQHFITYLLNEIPFEIISCCIYVAVVFWAGGLQLVGVLVFSFTLFKLSNRSFSRLRSTFFTVALCSSSSTLEKASAFCFAPTMILLVFQSHSQI